MQKPLHHDNPKKEAIPSRQALQARAHTIDFNTPYLCTPLKANLSVGRRIYGVGSAGVSRPTPYCVMQSLGY